MAGGTAALTRELVSGLRVHEDRMRRNLELTGPLLVSEPIMAELAPELDEASGEPGSGKRLIQDVVDRSLACEGNFRALLRAAVPESVPDARLDDLLDPAAYTGEAEALVDRLLAARRGTTTPPRT